MAIEFRHEPPAKHQTNRINVWWCPKGQKHCIRLLEEPLWVELHWRKGLSMACLGDECPEKWHKQPGVWRGYMAAMRSVMNLQSGIREWVPNVVEISMEVGKKLEGKTFGDLLVMLSREAKDNSPLEVAICAQGAKELGLPPVEAWDVRPILMRLWHANGRSEQPESNQPETTQPLRVWRSTA